MTTILRSWRIPVWFAAGILTCWFAAACERKAPPVQPSTQPKGATRAPAPNQQVQLGAILPLTGDGAKYGEEAQRGIDLAIAEINAKGGVRGRPLAVIYEDDRGTAKDAVTAFQKLVSLHKVAAVIGPMYSSTALAVAPVAERRRVVLFSPSASTPDYTDAGDYAFRNWPSDVFEGSVVAKCAYNKLRLRRVAILSVNLDYGVGLSSVFEKTFTQLGGTVPLHEEYDQGATNLRAQLTKIKGADVDALYLPGYYAEVATAVKQAQELALSVKLLSCVGFDNPKVLEVAGTAAEGLIFARPAYDPNHPDAVGEHFVATFRERYGLNPGTYAAHAYDATQILAHAMSDGGLSSDDIKNKLYSISNFPGVTGSTTFDSNGDVQKPIQIMTVVNGEFRRYE